MMTRAELARAFAAVAELETQARDDLWIAVHKSGASATGDTLDAALSRLEQGNMPARRPDPSDYLVHRVLQQPFI